MRRADLKELAGRWVRAARKAHWDYLRMRRAGLHDVANADRLVCRINMACVRDLLGVV